MKKVFLSGAILILAGVVGVRAQTDLTVKIHFAGAEKISADTNSTAFTNEFCSPAARALESQTLDKLSRAPAAWLKYGMPPDAGDGTAQLRPLLDDFLRSEWLFEIRDAKNGSPEYALAIRLSDDRARLWQTNLQSLLESWTHISAQKIPGGFELRKHQPPNLFRFGHDGDWVVIDCGENELSLAGEILEPFLKTKIAAAETNWLTADVNWPRLAQLFPAFAKFDFPKTELRVAGRDGNFWLNGKFTLAQPLPPLGKWQLPTNSIRQPLDSFTAVRGIAPWLAKQNWARRFKIFPPPDQWFVWSLAQIPFQTFAAAPVPDATAALAQLDAGLPPSLSTGAGLQNTFLASFTSVMTNNEITWRGLPFVSPFVQALHEPAGDFLFGGFFPNTARSPAPPELLAVFERPNLVYYHWEITAERLKLQLQLLQLSLLLTQHRQLDGNSDAARWLNLVGPKLGITVTEITQTAPAELTFERSAPGGLTALEFFALANWLEAPDFPGCDLSLTPAAETFKRPPAQTPGATSAPPVVSH